MTPRSGGAVLGIPRCSSACASTRVEVAGAEGQRSSRMAARWTLERACRAEPAASARCERRGVLYALRPRRSGLRSRTSCCSSPSASPRPPSSSTRSFSITSCNESTEPLLGYGAVRAHCTARSARSFCEPREIVDILSQQILDLPPRRTARSAAWFAARTARWRRVAWRRSSSPTTRTRRWASWSCSGRRRRGERRPIAWCGRSASPPWGRWRRSSLTRCATRWWPSAPPWRDARSRSGDCPTRTARCSARSAEEIVRMDMTLKDYLAARHDLGFAEVELPRAGRGRPPAAGGRVAPRRASASSTRCRRPAGARRLRRPQARALQPAAQRAGGLAARAREVSCAPRLDAHHVSHRRRVTAGRGCSASRRASASSPSSPPRRTAPGSASPSARRSPAPTAEWWTWAIARAAAAAPRSPCPAQSSATGDGACMTRAFRALVVDDEELYAQAIGRELESARRRPATSPTPPARRCAAPRAHRYQVILLDHRLPDDDGIRIIPLLLARQPGASLLMMTAYQTIPNAVQAIRQGAEDYVVKETSIEPLHRARARAAAPRRAAPGGWRLAGAPARGAARAARRRWCRWSSSCRSSSARPTPRVLLTGETGVGKEVACRYLHKMSRPAGSPLVAVDCLALPENLAESLLFGHEKGAFTGADQTRSGRLRGGPRRHRVPRRDRRHAADAAGQAAARAREPLLPSGRARRARCRCARGWWRPPTASFASWWTRARFRLDLYQRLSVFPDPHPAAARARRGHPAPGRALPRLLRRQARQAT